MRIAAEVIEDLSRASERRFDVYHPFGFPVSVQKAMESLRFSQGLEIGEELQISLLKSLLEVVEEFLAEQSGKDSDREEESLPAGYPLTEV